MTADESDEIESRLICWRCVGENYLRKKIKNAGKRATCNYCGKQARAFSIAKMADEIEEAFNNHYYITPTEPDGVEWAMQKDPDCHYEWEREGEGVNYVIQEAAEIEEQPAEDVRLVLEDRNSVAPGDDTGEENPFDSDTHYASNADIDDWEYQSNWQHFEHTLKTKTRFFNPFAQTTLDSIFRRLTDQNTDEGKGIVFEAGPETKLAAS